jgi:hypothetical protein
VSENNNVVEGRFCPMVNGWCRKDCHFYVKEDLEIGDDKKILKGSCKLDPLVASMDFTIDTEELKESLKNDVQDLIDEKMNILIGKFSETLELLTKKIK